MHVSMPLLGQLQVKLCSAPEGSSAGSYTLQETEARDGSRHNTSTIQGATLLDAQGPVELPPAGEEPLALRQSLWTEVQSQIDTREASITDPPRASYLSGQARASAGGSCVCGITDLWRDQVSAVLKLTGFV